MNLKHWTRPFRRFLVTALMIAAANVGAPAVGQDLWQGNPSYVSASNSGQLGWGDNRWLGSSGTNRQWQMGVDGTNTDAGVMVNQVRPNSPAFRAGISPRDRIVTVGGNQVGRVGGRIFDLSEQINHHATPDGSVDLLVYDGQSMQLRPVRVSLADRQAGLSGTLFLSDQNLPSNAVITVQLENASRPHYVIRNGEYSFRAPAYTNGPIPFTLNFDPNYIFPTDEYRVRAFVTSGGRTIYDTRQPVPVLTRGNPSTVQLTLTPTAYQAVSADGGYGSGSVITAGYPNYDAISRRVTEGYQRYLGRNPTSMELAAWHQIPDVEFRLSRLPLELMASQEYFDRVGNNNAVWIRKTFGEIIGRTPSALEFDQWMRRLADVRYSRMEVLNQMQSVAKS